MWPFILYTARIQVLGSVFVTGEAARRLCSKRYRTVKSVGKAERSPLEV